MWAKEKIVDVSLLTKQPGFEAKQAICSRLAKYGEQAPNETQ